MAEKSFPLGRFAPASDCTTGDAASTVGGGCAGMGGGLGARALMLAKSFPLGRPAAEAGDGSAGGEPAGARLAVAAASEDFSPSVGC